LPTAGQVAGALAVLALSFFANGCATWRAPAGVDDAALRTRAVSATQDGVRLSAAVLSTKDSRRLFGADVNATGVQPVWIEVENDTMDTVILLRAGIDPNYFSPLEVAWYFHAPLSPRNNAALDEHFDKLAFQNPIPPRSTRAGIIFANPHRHPRLLNVDILGDRKLLPFTLFPSVPDDADDEEADKIMARHIPAQAPDYQDSNAFRAALERLPCCASGAQGRRMGDPINVVLVGTFDDVAAAVVRRGFRKGQVDRDFGQRLFGRAPDVVVRKSGSGGVPANWMRVWLAPLRFRGQSVFLVQAGRPVGGRFAMAEGRKIVLHPDVDEVRNLLVQDLMYSGGLAKLGFATGVGAAHPEQPRMTLAGTPYHTDGLRAVMFFATRPRSLSDVQLLEWVPYVEHREAIASAQTKHGQP
jgi:hypothetical protein